MGSYEENKLHENTFYKELKTSSGLMDDLLDHSQIEPEEHCWQITSAAMDLGREDDLIRVLSRNNYRGLKAFKENVKVYKHLHKK